MRGAMRLNAAKLAALRRRYEKTREPEEDIAAAFDLTLDELRAMAAGKGLMRHPACENAPGVANDAVDDAQPEALPAAPRPESKPRRAKHSAAAKKKKVERIDAKIALVHRFYKSIASQLKKLDEQEGSKSQDRERASRAVSQLATSMEKTVSLHRAIENDKSQGDNPKRREALAHAEDMRRKIAEKLERLNSKRLGEREPENSGER